MSSLKCALITLIGLEYNFSVYTCTVRQNIIILIGEKQLIVGVNGNILSAVGCTFCDNYVNMAMFT